MPLTELGYELGLISSECYARFEDKKEAIEREKKRLRKMIVKPEDFIQAILTESGSTPLKDATNAFALLKRPEITFEVIEKMMEEKSELPFEEIGRASCREGV